MEKEKVWDQFEAYHKRMGRRATYDETPLPTSLDTSKISQEEQAEAEKIAENFEGKDSGGSIHVAEERNQEVDRKGLGEEELYSGVLRTCADVAKAAGGSSRTAPPSSSPFHSAAEKSEEDDTSAAAVSNDEV